MGQQKVSVFGLYSNVTLAEQALDSLTESLFASEDISVLMKSPSNKRMSGGTLGLLAGFGTLPTPGVDPMVAAGPMRSMLDGASEAAGSLEGSLISLGLTERDAALYAARIIEGSVLLSVRCGASEDVEKASHTFTSTGAEAIALVREARNHLESARIGSGR